MIHPTRTYASFPIGDLPDHQQELQMIKQQMLTWASPFNICCFLDSQHYPGLPSSPAAFEGLLAVGAVERVEASAGEAFSVLKDWASLRADWLFGHFSYSLASETEPGAAGVPRESLHKDPPDDPITFPDLFFFVPETVIELRQDHIRIGSLLHDPAALWQTILETKLLPAAPPPGIAFTPRFTRVDYLSTVDALQRHIHRGDCYEINFCQEFFARDARLDPYSIWRALSKASPNPFSAFYRLDHRFLCCASPERFLKKTGATLLSQPIKGTAPRDHADAGTDRLYGEGLRQSAKDKAENVMVVDLVRNDLARVCLPGSVEVPELFGVYPFPQVFQMISTVTGELRPGVHWSEAIRSCFPMGSMTGAPKNRVVHLIGQYERSHRGLYSGAVGYVTPDGDFDFNVVIRSLLYERESAYLSYQVGSGITGYSDPAAEYEECLVKAAGILKALGN